MQTHKGKPNAKKKERQSLVVEIDSESEDKNLLASIPPPPPYSIASSPRDRAGMLTG